jgi:hypothetical protein
VDALFLLGAMGSEARGAVADLLEASLTTALVAVGAAAVLGEAPMSIDERARTSAGAGLTSLKRRSGWPSARSLVSGSLWPWTPARHDEGELASTDEDAHHWCYSLRP